jgi:ribulose-phosphate 3-epimerase
MRVQHFNEEGTDLYMSFQLMASMMCADYSNLRKEVEALDAVGIDSFHIDIMDGRYVPNYAMSLNDLRCIRSLTSKPLDVHLMVEHPSNTIELFINSLRPGDTIYIHPETEYHPSTALQKIIAQAWGSATENQGCGHLRQ